MSVAATLTAFCGLATIITADFLWRNRIRAQFGILESGPEHGDVVVREVREIERPSSGTSQPFGLRFYKPSGRPFRAKVVHILPAAPGSVHGDIVFMQQSPRGYELHGEDLEYPGGGVRRLRLSATDPLGTYELRLYVNGSLTKSVSYNVVAGAS